jgi:hypothetical protein
MAAVDEADLNSAFASKLAALRAQLAKEGFGGDIISGYRSPEYQQGLINQGVRPAAKPWASYHQYGLAADLDLSPAGRQRMWELAPQFGLHALGSYDPDHVQLAGNLPNLIDQYKLAGWRPASQPAPEKGAIAYNGPGIAGGGSSGGAGASGSWAGGQGSSGSGNYLSQRDQHIQFIRDYAQKIGLNPDLALGIAGAEGLNAWSAKNPNAGSYVDRASGQPFSFGDFQLNTRNGMGVDARRAGIDPSDPNQWQAADRFALDRMKAGGVGPWSGDPVAKAYLATGKVTPFVAGNTLNTSGGPSAGSQTATGGSQTAQGSPPTTPGAWGSGQPQGATGGQLQGSPAAKSWEQAGKTLGVTGQQDKPPEIPPFSMTYGPTSGNPGGPNIAGPRSYAGAALAQQGYNMAPMPANMLPSGGIQSPVPSTVTSTLPGSATGLPTQGLGTGTTLNSPSQLQMAMLYGWPPYGGSYGQLGSPGGAGDFSGSY